MDLVHHSSPGSDVYSRTPISSKRMLNVKEFLFSDLQRRFPNILPPVDLYRVRCCWQESFPLLKPFQPQYSTTYQIIKETDAGENVHQPYNDDTGFAAYVLLLSLPAMSELMEKIVVKAESSSRIRGSLRKYIKILAVAKAGERLKAVGGSWNPELDGADPTTNPQTLLRSLIYKVLDHGRFHYRSLTDSEEPLSLANKSSVIFSDIDDDEYLLELVRGGDAILEDQTDVPSGSIIVLQKLDGTDVSQVANPEEFFQQVRTSEREHQKLMGQIRLQEQEIARLRTSVADFIEIKDKLSKAVLSMEDYRRRYRDERDRVDSMARVLDQQASVLDACRSALRQTSSRIHNRHLTSESSKQSFKRSSSPCSVASNRDLVKPYKKTKTPNPSRIASDSFNDENSAHSCHDVDAPKDTKGEKEKPKPLYLNHLP
ncbi:unnamed protein product [Heterobilharzia americana]|nr:unnamed protein product [Heterobilharzia americana]